MNWNTLTLSIALWLLPVITPYATMLATPSYAYVIPRWRHYGDNNGAIVGCYGDRYWLRLRCRATLLLPVAKFVEYYVTWLRHNRRHAVIGCC